MELEVDDRSRGLLSLYTTFVRVLSTLGVSYRGQDRNMMQKRLSMDRKRACSMQNLEVKVLQSNYIIILIL
jgi:hypothetical protein